MPHLTYPRGEQGQIQVRNPGAGLPQLERSTWTELQGKIGSGVKGLSTGGEGVMGSKRLPQNALFHLQRREPGGNLILWIFKYQVGRMKMLG